MTLYELTAERQRLLELAEDPEVDPEILQDTLEGLDGEIEDKADGYARVLSQMASDRAGLKAEIDRLTERVRRIDNSTERMKEALKNAMQITGKTKFKTELFSFSVQLNPPSVVIDDPDNIPKECLIEQPPKIDKSKLKEYLNNEDEAPFLRGIAHLERTTGLRIK